MSAPKPLQVNCHCNLSRGALLTVSGQYAIDRDDRLRPIASNHEAITFDIHTASNQFFSHNLAADQVEILRDTLTAWLDAVAAEKAARASA